MGRPLISIIIRARNEAASLPRCLELVREQEHHGQAAEIVLVDNGSADASAAVALEYGAQVLSLPTAAFTFGGALNLGASNARGEILVALSAHAFLPDPGWLDRLAHALSDPMVACASGDRYGPTGQPLTAAFEHDLAVARAHPFSGYSNAAGGFRAGLWRRRPFRTDLPGSEDREWAWYWLQQGYRCIIDPALAVEHDHTHDPVASIYRRTRREAEGLARFMAPELPAPPPLVREWWSDTRFYDSRCARA
jgi:rhamnosyltransferase